ncbi:hypothetical protein AVEN_148824-1 [Araneus ventricosus]|uniref:Uncharacterized protein n=1 Tax=Araneus ventricosus TaxID=182803 RepID=A0A4Y2WIK3_ARAVE|nr:hypothetical protein AVEN_148824-1 [Araneus ventricosus]
MQCKAYAYTCDVSNENQVEALADKVYREVGDVDILINNAGVLPGKPLLELTNAQIKKTFAVNSMSHMMQQKADEIPTCGNRRMQQKADEIPTCGNRRMQQKTDELPTREICSQRLNVFFLTPGLSSLLPFFLLRWISLEQ